MKMNKMLICIISIITIISILLVTSSYAKITDPTESPEEYKVVKANSDKLSGKVGPILGAIRNIGVTVSVISLMIIGIRYMLGSIEEKANYKQTMLPYLIGVIILFAGSTIPQLIYKTMKA